ncbi:MarR family transcriptional regulator [Desemzia sp. RIT804]|uniref:MarR family winged helix-turn-helix transcriptional regulator n=1 Tax=Desemzia sp. RIT 804 TaxID=2810209 RepID=UPI0019524C58|nr:MarR family transcriptional regulator [Desemzia sp. RIT 804]MBM6615152.1 MarR family transcriptional regulator [Desemzia sp. RIT 804]
MEGNHFLLEEQLCFSTYTLSKHFTKFYRPVLEPYSLTYPQYVTLLVLWEESNQSVQDLGVRLGLDSGTLTPMLKRMEAAGYITRNRSPKDERKVMVSLTDKAYEIKDELTNKVSDCLDLLNLEEKEYFDLLERINALTKTLGGTNND